jgi:acyl-CoA thioester hydrolase
MPPDSSRWSEYRHRRQVQFHEVDGFGIVHFSWYFRYLAEAQHALWRAAGLSIAQPGSDIGFPIVATAFEYRRPLHFEDEFELRIRVAAMSERTMRYECLVRRDGELLATGTMTIVCVSKQSQPMKSIPFPPEIAARFEVAADGAPDAAAAAGTPGEAPAVPAAPGSPGTDA